MSQSPSEIIQLYEKNNGKKVTQFLNQSYTAYKRGDWNWLFGKVYIWGINQKSIDELISHMLLNTEDCKTFESVFSKNTPLENEVFLYVIPNSGVYTNLRMHLTDSAGLIHSPIHLEQITEYEESGYFKIRQKIKLANGEVIDRKVPAAPSSKTILSLIDYANGMQKDPLSTSNEIALDNSSEPYVFEDIPDDYFSSDEPISKELPNQGKDGASLIVELIQINNTIAWYYQDRRYLSFGSIHFLRPESEYVVAGYGDNKVHKRVIEIGQALYAEGGKSLMREAHNLIKQDGRGFEEFLSKAWHGIGNWMY